ncbi:DUF218 domain protein [Aspergillus luchuensis]|uniref:DUF218 domain protein n=1 Tax=Aspergillus kawachii TaxID=1069201 RepID=A0A146FP88_ASPKA|nr:DUF218 domain protein [Aspergillus luchuensis]
MGNMRNDASGGQRDVMWGGDGFSAGKGQSSQSGSQDGGRSIEDSEPMATLRSGGLTKGWGWWREERENPAVVGEDERGACR